ncbi:MAG: hypothetical protein ABS46_19615 [Cytophagaceae bacterium SCN 52-12]|nr:MAG: hypothetical protein ABS46_19615 [Cytophagaceae bacterium SCN 52-12]
MRQQAIYEVKVEPFLQVEPGREAAAEITYFSNLKKAVDTIRVVLEANGWPVPVNYSAVYRQLPEKGFYTQVFVAENVRYFRLTISRRVMNPALSSLGIEEMPRRKRGI